MSNKIVTTVMVILAGAALAVAGYSCGGCSPSTQQIVVNQGPPAVACLPTFLPLIIDSVQKHDTGGAIVHTLELAACWAQHEPREVPPPLPAAPVDAP